MTRKSPDFFTAPAVMNWEMKILLLLVKDSEISRKPKGMAKERKKLTTSTQINHLCIGVMVSEYALNNRKKKKTKKRTHPKA